MARKRFQDLPAPAQAAIAAGAAVQIGLCVAAQIDITRRPANRIRGGKLRWRLLALINFVGPILYFARGRLPAGDAQAGDAPA